MIGLKLAVPENASGSGVMLLDDPVVVAGGAMLPASNTGRTGGGGRSGGEEYTVSVPSTEIAGTLTAPTSSSRREVSSSSSPSSLPAVDSISRTTPISLSVALSEASGLGSAQDEISVSEGQYRARASEPNGGE